MIKKKKFVKIAIIFCIMFSFLDSTKANNEKIFFDHKIKPIDGNIIDLKAYKNKPILLVNVASYCGFTKQYVGLQKLWDKYKDKGLVVIGVPSNSFNQEKDTNKEVKKFCEINFNINFPLTSIYDVKGENAHEIYKWAKSNYGNSAIPKWNFHKILIDKKGNIIDTFSSFTKPESMKIIKKIESMLN